MSPVAIEIIGYVASALIVLSLAMSAALKLRIISLIGSVTYVVYGLLIGSFPVALSNGIIVGLNIWNIYLLLRKRQDLDAVPMEVDSPFLADFLTSHKDDIRHSQPEYRLESGDTAFVLMRDGMPAGAIVGNREGKDLQVVLDYVLPAYRDARLGTWFYQDNPSLLRKHDIDRVITHPTTKVHRDYLSKVGFTPGEGSTMVRDLTA